MRTPVANHNRMLIQRALPLTLATFLLALGSLAVARRIGPAPPIWLANAVVMPAVLGVRKEHWLAWLSCCFVGNLAAAWVMGGNPWLAIGLAYCASFEVFVVAGLLRPGGDAKPLNLSRTSDLLRFLVAAGVIGPVASALPGASLVHLVQGTPFLALARTWVIGNALGMLILVPAFAGESWSESGGSVRRHRGLLLLAHLVLGTLVTAWVASTALLTWKFLLTPIVLAAVAGWGFLGGSITILVTALVALLTLAVRAHLPGFVEGLPDRLLNLQACLLVNAFISLPIASMLREHQETRARYRTMIDLTPEAILVYDVDEARFVDANGSAGQLFGCSRERLLEMAPTQFHRPGPGEAEAAAGRVSALLERTLAGERVTFERWIHAADGVDRCGEFRLVRLPVGRTRQILGSAVDITVRHEAEEALRRSEATLKEAQAIARLGNLVWHVDQGTVEWSEEMYRLFGFERARFSGTLQEILDRAIHPDDRLAVIQYNQEVLEGRTQPLDFRVIWPDGSLHHLRTAAGDVRRDADGVPVAVTGTVQDITERRIHELEREKLSRMYQALSQAGLALVRSRSREQLFRRICQALVEHGTFPMAWIGLAAPGPAGLEVAAQCGDVSGYLEALFGPNAPVLPEDSPAVQALRTGTPQILQSFRQLAYWQQYQRPVERAGYRSAAVFPFRTGDGERGFLAIYASEERFFDPEEVALLEGVAEDLAFALDHFRIEAEQRLAEARIRKLNEELEDKVQVRTAQLEATNRELEAFSYSVSHDLKGPLRAIDGFGKILAEDYADRLDAEGLHHLERIRHGAQHMGQLIEDLLKLSRIGRGELAQGPVNLSARAAAILARLAAAQPARSVSTWVEPGLVAWGDPRLVDIALENLLGNAWKYTSRQAEARIEFAVEPGDGHPAYRVRDNGAGFDMAYAGKLFSPFQRLHGPRDFEGSGIGLAIVQRIIHRHGGEIWAEAEEGRGATFRFTLPGPRAVKPGAATSP